MSAKHTPGPWAIVQDAPVNPRATFTIAAANRSSYVCTIKTERHLILDGNHRSNAALIAAAPDLLEVCQRILAAVEWTGPDERIDMLRAAIAKATGNQ